MRAALAILVAAAGCSHTTERMELTAAWRAPPATQFFLVGENKPDIAVPQDVLGRVLASIRGGLGEAGHTARMGFLDTNAARAAMAKAGCAGQKCVLVEVRVIGFSSGGNKLIRAVTFGAGDMHVELEVAFSDTSGAPIAGGHLDAQPYENDSDARVDRHVIPTIGPAFAGAIE